MSLAVNASQSRQAPLTCSGHTRPVVDLQFSRVTPDGFFLISACKDGNPMVRQGQTGDWIGTFQGHKGAVWSARLDATATKGITGSADFTAKYWDALTGDCLHTFSHKHIVRAVEFDPKSSSVFATGGQEKLIRIFNVENPTADPSLLEGSEGTVKSLVWDAVTGVIYSGADEKLIRVWDPRSMKQVNSIALESAATSLELCWDGKTLLTTSGKSVQFWDLKTLTLQKEHKLKIDVSSASLHPDGSVFVAGGSDLWVHVHAFDDGHEIEHFKGHHGPVHAVRYSPDGEMYATGSEDGTIRLWQTRPGTNYGLWQFNKKDGLPE